VPGLDVVAELRSTADSSSYRARRYGVDYTLTVFNRDRASALHTFHRDASLLAEIAHPRLPGIYEVGELAGLPYLVTDLIAGRPLADLIAGDPLSVPQAMRVILDIVEPLAAMHRQGLIHRELSSQKLIVLADGTARLLDAGLGGTGIANPAAPDTLGYLAPEQTRALARPVDNRTDLYSLGVVLFECLTGTLPFPAAEVPALAELQASRAAPDPRTLAGDLPESLAMLVTTLLAREPGERYQSGEELAADLRLLLGEPAPAPERSDPWRAPRLIGRERELELISELWDQVRRGRGRAIAVRGVSGVGKTSLTDEVLRGARRSGTPVLALSCRPGDPEPLGPLRRAVEDLLLDGELLPPKQRKALHAQVREAAGSAAPLLAQLSPALGDLLGITPLPETDRHDQFAAAVGRFITELARLSGGLVLATDNGELVDQSTLRVMSHLAADIADVPMLSIGSVRTDRRLLSSQDPLLPAIRAATDLDLVLEPLERPGMDELLRSRLPGIDLDSALAELLRGHGGGNPFVLLEHLRSIIDTGLIHPHWGSWLLDEGAADRLRLPDDPLALVLTGIAALEPTTRRVLVVAAVTGMRFQPLEIAEIGDLDPAGTFRALADAVGHRFIELTDEGGYGFRHERIREAALTGIGADEAARLHQRAAEVLGSRPGRPSATQTYAIAQHYLLGTPPDSPDSSDAADAAFASCSAAGRLALQGHAPGQAATLFEHAARLRPDDARLLYTLGTALHRDGRYPDARQRLEEALVVEKDELRRARILLRLSEVHRSTRNTPKAVTTIEWGLAELDAALPDARLFRAIGALRAGLVAFFIVVTGWGFGSARSRNRERQDLLTALHLLGGHLGGANLRPAALVMHRLYGARAAVRVGAGAQYAVNCAAVGLTAARYGWSRLHRRSLALAERAAADLADPQLVAQIAWYSGAADYLGRVDNGERWIQCLTDHGQWLNSEQYSDTISAVCWDAAVQGRDDDVLRWAESGRTRRAFGDSAELTALLTIPAVGLTAAGRPAAANAELRRVRETLEQHGGRSLKVNLVLAELYALLEQDQLGAQFDEVAERFFAFELSTTGMLRQHQSFFVLYAQGRLAQCRAAQDAIVRQPMAAQPISVEARLKAARVALRQLKKVAYTPLLKAGYQQCRAELLVLEGRPKRALRLLSRLKPLREDAPLLGFEIARTIARALLVAGYPAESRRQVLSALHLAENNGWTGRRSRLAIEFGLRSASADQATVKTPETAADLGTTADADAVAKPIAAIPAPRSAPDSFVHDSPRSAPGRERDLAVTLRDTLVEMSSLADPLAVLQQLVAATERVLPGGQAWLVRPASRVLGSGLTEPGEVLFAELPAPGSVRVLVFDPDLRAVAAGDQPVIGTPERIVPPQLRRLLAGSASWVLFPLVSDGSQVGVLILASVQPRAYADTEIAVAGALVAQAMAAHAKATLIARLQELAGTDEQTGVRSLRQVLELATRDLLGARHSSRPLVVMVIGIDHLGRINDLHGRAAGDDVIRQVAIRLSQVIRDTDLVGRYGEDEFIIVLSQGRDGEDGIGDGGLEVADRLLSTVSQTPIQTRVGPLPITVTVGLTLLTKEDAEITSLTARAEAALHIAKQGGRNQVSGI